MALTAPKKEKRTNSALQDSSMTANAPDVDEIRAAQLAVEYYGIEANAKCLVSEKDANFRLDPVRSTNASTNGQIELEKPEPASTQRYTLKVVNAEEPKGRSTFATDALAHISVREPNLPIPQIISNLAGDNQTTVRIDGTEHVIRMLTYLDGAPLSTVPVERMPLSDIGACLGQLDRALSDFEHPHMHFSMLWDSANVDGLSDLLKHVPPTEDCLSLETALKQFSDETKPKLSRLRHQIIHNDANLSNLLVDQDKPDQLTGIFDFGDMIFAPTINELGVVASYHVREDASPAQTIGALAAGYHQAFPLTAEEVSLLPALAIARQMTTILITHWRAELFPDNAPYILRNNRVAWRGFTVLMREDQNALISDLREACGMEL
ncbi:MAG: phosphotransferase [Pseudomonadota bacterium]